MKGSIFDVLVLIIIVFAFSIIVLVGGTLLQDIQDTTENITMDVPVSKGGDTVTISVVNQTILDKGQTAFNRFDTMMAFILICLIMVAAVMAFMIPTHPVMIVPAIFVMIIVVIIAAQLTNAYGDITSNEQFQTQAENMPITAQIMNNFPLIALLASVIVIIATFVVVRRQDSGGVAG